MVKVKTSESPRVRTLNLVLLAAFSFCREVDLEIMWVNQLGQMAEMDFTSAIWLTLYFWAQFTTALASRRVS